MSRGEYDFCFRLHVGNNLGTVYTACPFDFNIKENNLRLQPGKDCLLYTSIAAVKDEEGLRACLDSEIRIVFVLYGDICSISGIVGRLKDAGKTVIVHLDLISGLSGKEIAVSFIHSTTAADGIISTKPALIRQAKELGMFTVMRFFAIDSMAFENIRRQSESVHPDFIEVLPGLMPKVIRRICAEGRIPVIAGGLITDREDIMAALNAGAISISTTNRKVWFM